MLLDLRGYVLENQRDASTWRQHLCSNSGHWNLEALTGIQYADCEYTVSGNVLDSFDCLQHYLFYNFIVKNTAILLVESLAINQLMAFVIS